MNEIDICASLPSRPLMISPLDFDLNSCGMPQVPSNARYVDLYKVYAYSNVLAGAGDPAGGDILLDEKKTVDCHSDFILHKITPLGANPPGAAINYFVRFQWPNGRYSSQVLQDVRTFLGVCYTKDSNGKTQGIRIPAGRDIGIALQNTFVGAVINVTILFEGVSRYYLCAPRRTA